MTTQPEQLGLEMRREATPREELMRLAKKLRTRMADIDKGEAEAGRNARGEDIQWAMIRLFMPRAHFNARLAAAIEVYPDMKKEVLADLCHLLANTT